MLFNSLAFVVFFVAVFILYWSVFNRSAKLQNILLLASSYLFYAFWDGRFLGLLILSSVLNYILGYYMGKTARPKTKRMLLNIGIITSLGSLAYFKYANFFITSFITLLARFHVSADVHTLGIILPLGISFFTFRNLGYLFDINRGKIKPTTDGVAYLTFVAFFPCLISGPIDKAALLMPQLEKKRKFSNDEGTDGLRQILWGLFKKTVIADNCSSITNPIFDHYHSSPASTLLIGAFLYTIQVYADFSGYSDMAIGIARLLGLNITRNFDFPFFAQNIAEFWRKWHISLTSWLTDYVFTPLSIAFRDYGKAGLIMAILINFTLIGIWHGPNWTFVLFGFLHGCYYIPLIVRGTLNKRKKLQKGRLFPSFTEFRNITGTFILVMLTFVIFRSDSIPQAFNVYKTILSKSLFYAPVFENNSLVVHTFIFILFFMAIEWVGKDGQYALAGVGAKWPSIIRWPFYYGLLTLIFLFAGSSQQFIYFQF
ncbi:MAG TPA: MBOAT family O-acyltransferase [Mucilaginibacter sp.]|nr:MBOAT family O-acyltransferase [Mucilaginibacter sp.]